MDNVDVFLLNVLLSAVLALMLFIAFKLKVPKTNERKTLVKCPTCKRWHEAT